MPLRRPILTTHCACGAGSFSELLRIDQALPIQHGGVSACSGSIPRPWALNLSRRCWHASADELDLTICWRRQVWTTRRHLTCLDPPPRYPIDHDTRFCIPLGAHTRLVGGASSFVTGAG